MQTILLVISLQFWVPLEQEHRMVVIGKDCKRPGNIGEAMIEMAKTDKTKLGECVVYLYTDYTGDYNINKIKWVQLRRELESVKVSGEQRDSIVDIKYVAIKKRIENN